MAAPLAVGPVRRLPTRRPWGPLLAGGASLRTSATSAGWFGWDSAHRDRRMARASAARSDPRVEGFRRARPAVGRTCLCGWVPGTHSTRSDAV